MGNARSFFITGSASGIGKYLTEQLVDRKCQVFAADVNFAALDRLAREKAWPADRVKTSAMDVRDPEAWNRAFDSAVAVFGKVDVCMNVAGVLRCAWVQDTPPEDVQFQIDVNVKGVMFGTITAARHMVARKQGHIINIASLAGLGPVPGLSVYCGAKYAVRGFSLAAAQELRPHNVFVTVFCPDSVNTPLLDAPLDNEAGAMIWSGKHLLTVEEVGDAILGKILTEKPMVRAIPFKRQLLARLGDQIPVIGLSVIPRLLAKGRRERLRLREGSPK